MRLIDADDTLDTIEKYCGDYFNHDDQSFDKNAVRIVIKMAETIDPVHFAGGCYCKECKYYKPYEFPESGRIIYQCCNSSASYLEESKPDDFCSKGTKRLPLQDEIIEWLNNRAFFADTITKTEYLMQQIYLDKSSNYEGKQKDQEEIANNCKTVADAYYYVQTHKLNVNKFYKL